MSKNKEDEEQALKLKMTMAAALVESQLDAVNELEKLNIIDRVASTFDVDVEDLYLKVVNKELDWSH